ncbi:hypothetical protein EYB53_017745 [Candidatus Chloroploca sp. M-50]|uniref:Uncharacterized protein n=1 Tax=Candidatus Chloroploca mongolica TaxID=2528176 RepID=A0ABS4DDP3_9CHLR|nr:hypothetical protein [Candidatus Chloroploca mongolica]MBP1467561.1 hypothetical protein [Candidatus Chloroploca mongolica]
MEASSGANPSRWQREINNILEVQIARYPFLVQMRALMRQLQDERANWPVLLPLLFVFFVLVYRNERKKVKRLLRHLAE